MADLLAGGDRRSIGAADEAAAAIAADGRLAAEAVGLLESQDPVIRMRAADALEKASRCAPEILEPQKTALLRVLLSTAQHEVQWNLLQLLPRLDLHPRERRRVRVRAETLMASESRIVVAEAMTALFTLARSEPGLRETAVRRATYFLASGSPALRARARRLLRTARVGPQSRE